MKTHGGVDIQMNLLCDVPGILLGESALHKQMAQVGLLLLGKGEDVFALELKLLLHGFALGLHGDVFTRRHGERAGQQAHGSGNDHGIPALAGSPRYAHH